MTHDFLFTVHETPGPVAQSVGHLTPKSGVLGSIPGQIGLTSRCIDTPPLFSTILKREMTHDFLFTVHETPGPVAQSVGHLTPKSGVLGSIPGLATCFRFSFRFFKKDSCQLLAKVCAQSTG